MWSDDGNRRVRLDAGPVYLRRPDLQDYTAWAELRAQSRAFLEPWEPNWSPNDLERTAFRLRLRHYEDGERQDSHYAFFLFHSPSHALVGAINMSNVRRGVSQTATLGYWMGERFAGHGLMSAAVQRLCQHAFAGLGLHRLEAACQPHNLASRRVLVKAGFQLEGYAQRYLWLNGEWRDHLLFARMSDDDTHASARE
jgi:ribosomal-protein-alanine N-acetyltransferase